MSKDTMNVPPAGFGLVWFFKQSRKYSSSPAHLHLDSSKSASGKQPGERSMATDCHCLGKGNPLGSISVVSMGTALLVSAGHPLQGW